MGILKLKIDSLITVIEKSQNNVIIEIITTIIE